ncbi:MAG: ectoine hydroxylase-related dioxygenase (phytanoyl-CoA dioxygenase family) [Candidatus Azotimanducaceae bacterium]|jgi:ectoine hydroxylase-related dioxygenase (phytanoyl-CoA dioxygenase family)|tara:strand:- start:11295 stop:12164 length:870 start_codon:yes stop_codon:yes gene_type:complete
MHKQTVDFPYLVSDSVVEEFRHKGFVVTDGVFALSMLEHYASAVDTEVALRTTDDLRKVEEKTIYEQSFVQCMRLWETNDIVRNLSCDAGLAGIAAQLLGVDGLHLWQDQALYKESGGRETDPHQDQTFWPIGDADLISAWIPFDAVTFENGAMAYVPGSHKAGGLKPVDITHSTEPYDILADPALAGAVPEWVAVNPGNVVWHNGFTVHQAAANTSANLRRVFTVVFVAAGSRRTKPWPAFPVDRARVPVGGLIEGDGLPVVWPSPKQPPSAPNVIGVPVGPQYKLDT